MLESTDLEICRTWTRQQAQVFIFSKTPVFQMIFLFFNTVSADIWITQTTNKCSDHKQFQLLKIGISLLFS